jgi:tetratricopeptide (TPR) repeat protein
MRAAALLSPTHPDLPPLLMRSGEARFEAGNFAEASEAISRAGELAERSGDIGGAATAEVERLRFSYETGSAGSADQVRVRVDELLGVLDDAGHEAGAARAWRLIALMDAVAGRFGSAEEALLHMVDHAARSGDEVLEVRMLQNLAVLAPVGPTPVDVAIPRCEEVLARVESDRRAAANTRRALAQLHAMIGDLDTARLLYSGARSTLLELGWRLDAALVSLDSGPIELLVGDPAVAESELQRDYEALAAMGDAFYLPTTTAFLSEALYRQGRVDEAEGRAQECSRSADPDDLAPQVLWRAVQARIDAGRGGADALALAQEAVSLSEASDGPILQADALLALAEVATALGEDDIARDAAGRAMERYEAKGSRAGMARVERLMTDTA